MEEDIFTSCFEELIPPRPIEHLGEIDLTFDGKLSSSLKINEDGGEAGCGGKIWIAGELLCDYIAETSTKEKLLYKLCPERNFTRVLELGSGTGLVGLFIGALDTENDVKSRDVYITDVDQLIPLMEANIKVNNLDKNVFAQSLWWGEPVPHLLSESPPDLVLAADCVYLESAFPLLERTLLDLSNIENPPVILMSYKKRRKADKHFFLKIKKNFDVIEIKDFTKFKHYQKQRAHLFQLVRHIAVN